MGILAQRMNTMSVKVMSPDETVRLYLTGGGQLHLEFAHGSIEQHTEKSLASQLSHLCTKALRTQEHAMSQVLKKTIAEIDVDEDDTFTETSLSPPKGPAQASTAISDGITSVGRSPRSAITVRRIPGAIMEVKIRKGTLQRWSVDEITVEIYSALRAAADDHRRQLREARQRLASATDLDHRGDER